MINGFLLSFKNLCCWIARYGAAIFAFALPLHMLCTSYALIIWFLFSLLFMFQRGYSLSNFFLTVKKTKISLLFLVFYLQLCLGLFYTENFSSGLEKITICIPFVITPVLFWLNKEFINVNIVVKAFLSGLFTSVVLCLVSFLLNGDFSINAFCLEFNLFHHPSYYSMLITLALALFLFQLPVRSSASLFFFLTL